MALTDAQLRRCRSGDRLDYHGVTWQIDDYSTYTDAPGYETEEWLLKSTLGKEYYLMREIDPAQAEQAIEQVTWYLAEEVRHPTIYAADNGVEVTIDLASAIRSGREPYPALRMYNRTYEFESQTRGTYRSDDDQQERITWDYWDVAHLWNLALEAWPNGNLVVYSTRMVQPEDFTETRSTASFGSTAVSSSAPAWATPNQSVRWDGHQTQVVLAIAMMLIGLMLMIAGI